jgi:hypothetical protein
MQAAKIAIAALLLMAPLLATGSFGADGASKDAPFIEFRSAIPDWYNIVYNDTDRDGIYEIFCQGRDFLRVFDPPSYNLVLSLDDIYENSLFEDLNNNASIQIIIYYKGIDHFNCSVISGTDFRELWRSPDINGSLISNTVKDLDGDGVKEFVWIAHDNSSGQNISRVQIWSWENRTLEWESPPILKDASGYDSLTIMNIDSDPQPEIIVDVQDPRGGIFDTESLKVYDGLTHQLQWEIVSDGAVHYMTHDMFVEDMYNDSSKEILLEYRETNSTGWNSSGLLLLSSETGAILWNVTTVGNFSSPQFGDLDGDGGTEVLISGRDGDYPSPYNATYEIFDIGQRQRIWFVGPCQQNSYTYGEMSAKDINGDGKSEIIFDNTSFPENDRSNWSSRYQILDGQNFSVLWNSPEIEGGLWEFDTASFCDTERPVILLNGFSEDTETGSNGSLRVISTDDFRELWRSPTYAGRLETTVEDYVNDSRKELLLTYQYPGSNENRAILIETRTFNVLWTSPATDGSIPYFTITSADLAGDSGAELIFINTSFGTIYSGNSVSSVTNTTIMLFNTTTFEEIWRSDTSNDGAWISAAWDLDNDSNVELVLNEYHEDYAQWEYYLTIWEFPRANIAEPGMYSEPPSIDLQKPKNGDVLWGIVNVSGIATDDYRVSSVEVRIDDGPWIPAALRLSADKRFCDWNLTWNASLLVNGTHRISARSFAGQRQSPEVSVTVTVKEPEVKRPKPPQTTLGAFPDPVCLALALVCLAGVAFFIVYRLRK